MFLTQFLTVAVVHLLAVMSPGPDFAVVTRNSLIYSRKTGVYTALGIALGILVHVSYCLLGVGLIITKSIILFNTIKYLGAFYLIYIGWKSLRTKAPTEDKEKTTPALAVAAISDFSAVRIGFLTNLLNPKATLFFLALFTQVINPITPKIIQLGYGLETVLITFVWFAMVSVLFSNSLVKAKVSRFQHYIERATGVVLIALGIKVALSTDK